MKRKRNKKRQAISAALGAAPSQGEINLLLTFYQANRLEEAESLAVSLIQKFPLHPFAWKVLGVLYQQTSRPRESLAPMQKAVELSSQDAEAHFNLGVTLRELGRLEDAEASFLKAIELDPDYPEAYNSLGVTLHELGRLEDAISSYVSSINLKEDSDRAFSNLGQALSGVRFKETDKRLYPILLHLITGTNLVRPADVAEAILSFLRHNSELKNLLQNSPIDPDIEEVKQVTAVLAQIPLLNQLMRVCSLPDLEFEAIFVSIRRALLKNLVSVERSPETIDFLSTLSLHCFTNEFVYPETTEELELICNLEATIAECMSRGLQPPITEVLCLATYRPLYQYQWSERLQVLQQLPEVQSRLIEEPRAERAIALAMPVLAGIQNEVSRKVRGQYEDNPYPRWVKLKIPLRAKSVAEVCDESRLKLYAEAIRRACSPSILIAGCGTGQHSIETASRFVNSHVTAVDLSCTSLAYAWRKTSDLGISNVSYLQADLLRLEELGQQFDIVESVGVLHHMDDPMAGWRVLTNVLKSGGLMKIGLYSESARRHIMMIREEIAALGIGTSGSEIRHFRQSVIKSDCGYHQSLKTSFDFFSLSTLRDLIFHVQEHRFTLPQIQSCLDELGLKFCGFEGPDIVAKFKKSLGEKSDPFDLLLWHQFEEQTPKTFIGMYQFWCQKA